MAFYIGNTKQIIDNDGNFKIAVYSTRADLPSTGVRGYMAFVQDQGELVVNTGNTNYPNPNNTQPVTSGVGSISAQYLTVGGNPEGIVTANYLIVGGGGGGGAGAAGGGGSGGGYHSGSALLFLNTSYNILVGAGGNSSYSYNGPLQYTNPGNYVSVSNNSSFWVWNNLPVGTGNATTSTVNGYYRGSLRAVTTASTAKGEQAYTTPGTYSWTAPPGVTSVSVVAVGGGGSGEYNNTGGALGWKNNISVVPGQSYTVVVGAGGPAGSGGTYSANGGDSYFISNITVSGQGGRNTNQSSTATYVGDGGGDGGDIRYGGGGGGAGGYTAPGGRGGGNTGSDLFNGFSSDGGGGGGGGAGAQYGCYGGGGGGGVGIFGQGTNGVGGVSGRDILGSGGTGGSGGGSGASQPGGTGVPGGLYGGGGGWQGSAGRISAGAGGGGAVRIIWPGTSRRFPSTDVALSSGPATISVEYLVVGGGGSGGGGYSCGNYGGGGGAGGMLAGTTTLSSNANYPVTVGAGGAGVTNALTGNSGGNSSFNGVTAYGGGGGGYLGGSGQPGGSGGGVGWGGVFGCVTGGTGISGQGNDGSSDPTGGGFGGGGGGASAVGGFGFGGAGRVSNITGASVVYATGGSSYNGGNAANNTGNGGAGWSVGYAGGSGIVVVKYTSSQGLLFSGGTIIVNGTTYIHTFRSSGTLAYAPPPISVVTTNFYEIGQILTVGASGGGSSSFNGTTSTGGAAGVDTVNLQAGPGGDGAIGLHSGVNGGLGAQWIHSDYYGGGGGGGSETLTGSGGAGGGGAKGQPGIPGTGGGGGSGASGAPGVVTIEYAGSTPKFTGGTVVAAGGYVQQIFTASGTLGVLLSEIVTYPVTIAINRSFNLTITGGAANTTVSWRMVTRPAGVTPTASSGTLDVSGSLAVPQTLTVVGTYSWEFTFAATGNTRTVQFDATTAVTASTSPDDSVTWYKLLIPDSIVAQTIRLDQGTLNSGYYSIVNWNQIHQLQFSTDSASLRPETCPWASKYSTAMSSNLFAYYHAGITGFATSTNTGEGNRSCRQSWSTYAVSQLSTVRENMTGGFQVTLYSTSNLNNNYGIMQYGGESAYFIFATDTLTTTDSWYTNGSGKFSNVNFNDPRGGNNYGLSANGPLNGYVNYTNVSKFNWSSQGWTTTGQGAPNAQGGWRGGHSTPYNKFYYGYNVYIDIYNTTVDLWNVRGGTLYPLFADDARFSDASATARSNLTEGSSITGQDWGYVYSMFDYGSGYQTPPAYTSSGPYTNLSQKMYYATDTQLWSPSSDLKSVTGYYGYSGVISGNSASGCSGPTS
jgi:hypothetical protein